MHQRNGIEQDEKTKKYKVKLAGKVLPQEYNTSTEASQALVEARVKQRRKSKQL